jgi:alkanesulfonate monooxygenase
MDNANRPVEMGWFAPCCEDDYEFLGIPDPRLASTVPHVGDVIVAAECAGFGNILLPSGFNTGVDSWTMAAYVASQVKQIHLLPAVRVGEQHPPMFARAAANLDRVLGGRLNINIISSPLAGLPPESSAVRYRRTREFMQLVKLFWQTPQGETVAFDGEHYQIHVKRDLPEPVRFSGPPLYFGGGSPEAKDAAAAFADVYLFWGDTVPFIRDGIAEMRERAASYGRTLVYGLRVHVIARPTESEAHEAAQHLISRLDADVGKTIKERALDKESVGKARQNALLAQGEWADSFLWTGIGRGRPGCGTAIVGSYEQVERKLREYMALGIEAFILSGYPHREEAQRFGQNLLPRFVQTSGAMLIAARENEKTKTPLP